MAPAIQILASALLFSVGLITPEGAFAMPSIGFSPAILSITALTLASLIAGSFILSRFASWYINR
jgi:hypothetical protein